MRDNQVRVTGEIIKHAGRMNITMKVRKS